MIQDEGDRRLFSRFNLTVPRSYALIHIGDQPGISLSQLSQIMLCDKSNITRLIKGLEAEGLVMRRPHETDGRALRLYLTETGESMHEQVHAAHVAYNKVRFDCTEELEQSNLMEGMLKL